MSGNENLTTATTANLCAHVLDPEAMDQSVRPQDDFYRHVNGKWLDTYEIPADLTSYGSFIQLRDLSEKRCRELVERLVEQNKNTTGQMDSIHPEDDHPDRAQPNHQLNNEEKISLLYQQYLDQTTADRLGTEPIQPLLHKIQAVTNHDELAALLGEFALGICGSFFTMGIEPDLDDPTRWSVYLGQAGLGLPDEAYYHKPEYEHYRQAYEKHVTNLFNLSGIEAEKTTAATAAAKVLEFETKLADLHWDAVKCRDWNVQNNPRTWEEVQQQNPDFNWLAWMEKVRLPQPQTRRYLVQQLDYLQAASHLVANTDLATLKLWLGRKIVSKFAPLLSDDIVQENFYFYSRTLSGTSQLRPRWKRALSLVEGVLGESLGRLYVAKYFPPAAKERMDQLVANLLDAYQESIQNLEWMTADTKRQALKKLEQFTPKIGYPTKWRDYSDLHLDVNATLVDNVIAASQFERRWEMSRIDKPVDREEWAITPQTVNAYYNPQWNEIVFPAAILQPPFFDMAADDAVNYAAIGAVIGHEIGHGFDDQGSQFDGSGQMRNWWTDQDRQEFAARTQKLVDQYEVYTPTGLDASKYHVSGALTLGENIGDLAGLTIAWKAYEKALAQRGITDAGADQIIDGLTGPQRFFYSWARIWRQKSRSDWQIQLLAVDPHSPNEFRCNGVLANFDAFAKYFDVKPGDALYREPAERIHIW